MLLPKYVTKYNNKWSETTLKSWTNNTTGTDQQVMELYELFKINVMITIVIIIYNTIRPLKLLA
jgi:hypothetical protein